MFFSIFRDIKIAFQNFYRNIGLFLVTIIIIILALFSINLLIVLNILTNASIDVIKKKIDISVYFKPETSQDQVFSIKSRLEVLPEVENVQFLQKKDALLWFQKKHKDDPKILEALQELDDNPLGDSLIIQAKKIKDYKTILNILDERQYKNFIYDKDFGDYENFIDQLNLSSNKAQQITLIISIIFIFIGILVIFNTVKITIHTRREEIGIMKLVGATNWFIKIPFILETIICGIFAFSFCIILFYPFLYIIQPLISGFLEDYNFNIVSYFNRHFLQIFGWQFVFIVILSIISSILAIKKYLKV
jgi:cell division transport system permease protein